MLMVHEFGQRMVAQGHGAIINVGSTVIVRGSPRGPQCAGGRCGLLGITPTGRVPAPEEMTGAALFLASADRENPRNPKRDSEVAAGN